MRRVVPSASGKNVVRMFMLGILRDPIIPVSASVLDMPTRNTLAPESLPEKSLASRHKNLGRNQHHAMPRIAMANPPCGRGNSITSGAERRCAVC